MNIESSEESLTNEDEKSEEIKYNFADGEVSEDEVRNVDLSIDASQEENAVYSDRGDAESNVCLCNHRVYIDESVGVWRCEHCQRPFHRECLLSIEKISENDLLNWECSQCAEKRHYKSGMMTSERLNVAVGSNHQVPCVPPIFFLNELESFLPARLKPTLMWSSKQAQISCLEESDVNYFISEARKIWPANLYVKSRGLLIQKQNRRTTGWLPRYLEFDTISDSENGDADDEFKSAASRPDVYTCPFSVDMALSVLHNCKYDTKRALEYIQTRNFRFNFDKICHPPRQPYRNKWRPTDRRWKMDRSPFPSLLSSNSDKYGRLLRRF